MDVAEMEDIVQELIVGAVDHRPKAATMKAHSGPYIDALILHQLLPSDCIPEIIRKLPPPLPGVGPKEVVVSAWPQSGRFRFVMTVRRNALQKSTPGTGRLTLLSESMTVA